MNYSVDQGLRVAQKHEKNGSYDDALQVYRQLVEKYPNNVRVQKRLEDLSRSLKTRGKTQAEITALEELAALHAEGNNDALLNRSTFWAPKFPASIEVLNFKGVSALALGQFSIAIEAFKSALHLSPDLPILCHNLADSYLKAGRIEAAKKQAEHVLKIEPRFTAAHDVLGKVYAHYEDHEKAKYHFEKYVEANPQSAYTFYELGSSYKLEDKPLLAAECFLKAHKIDDRMDLYIGTYLEVIKNMADWETLKEYESEIPKIGLRNKVSPLPFLTLEDTPANHLKRSTLFVGEDNDTAKTYPRMDLTSRPEKLKIGYFSADFHNHPGMHLMSHLLKVHDRERFEIHAFSYGPNTQDEMRRKIVENVDYFHDVREMSDEDTCALARHHGIHIALHRNGHTLHTRTSLFAERVAPIQINYLGYPSTLGATFIDYIVGDPVVIPKHNRKYFSEKCIYMPHTYQVNDNTRKAYEGSLARADYDLPEDAFVFCCFNAIRKISRFDFEKWARILNEIDNSVLWLYGSDPIAEENILKYADGLGISRDRIIFASWQKNDLHLARYKLADLVLDTDFYNAHTTASDALWMGVPIVTKLGESFSARVAASLLTALDVPELITTSDEEYCDLVLKLARDPALLKSMREKIEANRLTKPLFNTELYARHIENGFDMAFQRYIDGSAPDHIVIEDQQI